MASSATWRASMVPSSSIILGSSPRTTTDVSISGDVRIQISVSASDGMRYLRP